MTLFWSTGTFDKLSIPENIINIYNGILPYVKSFLCSPHPYRKGIMCPFVPAALRKDSLYFTYYDDTQISESGQVTFQEKSKLFIRKCIEFYISTILTKGVFGALIILFPKDYDIKDLLEIHFINKKKCVDNYLMIGALWDKNPAQSLHKSDFYPLRTPTPILVIRDITVQDLVFLDPKHYSIRMRISFLNSFIKKFTNKSKNKQEINQVRQAISIQNAYLKRMAIFSFSFIFFLSVLIIFLYEKIK